ncbi:MAG: tetratricopeptide repeat protein [Saprospiraceae bacterium]|nr:tetratricopeptide repeat protein [Saprospiraceae bacterium]
MRIFLILFIAVISFGLTAQDSRLAHQYYQSGEYEKAASMYLKLFNKTGKNDYYFNRYIESLIAIEEYEEAEKGIKNQIKNRPNDVQLYVTYGNLYEKQFDTENAEKQYKRAIENMEPDVGLISRIGSSFTTLAKYDLAIEVFEKGEKLIDRPNTFSYNLAGLYHRKGDTEKMIEAYLNSVARFRNNINNLINTFQRYLEDEGYVELQKQLYERIQEDDTEDLYNEILAWTFIHRKEYKKAFRQARSVDRRNDENGGRVFEIADIAYNDKAYDVAIQAYQYVTDTKGENSSYYLDAKRGLLNSKKKKITGNYDYTKEDLVSLKSEYNSFLDEFGRNRQTALLMSELADFEALYLNDLDTAIFILQELIGFAGVDKYIVANAKLNLADYLLMQGDVWESTLLYSQVDKDMKEGVLGERARFRNAMLSYYRGDFEWAQEQFDILKTATSKLISNDAIDRSVFIMDNLGLDTTDVPLRMFAISDQLIFQNRFDEAFDKMDSILILFPEHGLEDDILYNKANIFKRQKKYDEAIAAYDTIIVNYPEEIRADNALFELAELYEKVLLKPEKAKDLYEKLFLDFSGSTFAIESRKRFRILRGDDVQ